MSCSNSSVLLFVAMWKRAIESAFHDHKRIKDHSFLIYKKRRFANRNAKCRRRGQMTTKKNIVGQEVDFEEYLVGG
jgi:hypothetical protein